MKTYVSTTLDSIRNNETLTAEQLFNLVNCYKLTTLSLSQAGTTILTIPVNTFDSWAGNLQFSQDVATEHANFQIKEEDVLSVAAKLHEDNNEDGVSALYITAQLTDNRQLHLTIIHPFHNINSWNEYQMLDIFDLDEYLQKLRSENKCCFIAKVETSFGLELKMWMCNAYIFGLDDDGLDEEAHFHIADQTSSFDAPIFDSYNLFYVKETENYSEIIIKPYGTPFTEIKMLFTDYYGSGKSKDSDNSNSFKTLAETLSDVETASTPEPEPAPEPVEPVIESTDLLDSIHDNYRDKIINFPDWVRKSLR